MEKKKRQILTADSLKARRETIVQITPERIEEEREKIAREIQRKAKVRGFRPGKAPLSMVKQLYKQEIEEEAKDRVLKEALLEDIKAQGYEPVGMIRVTSEKENNDGGLEITANFEVIPNFTLPALSSIKIKRKIQRVVQSEVEQEIQRLKQSLAEYKVVDREADDGYVVLADLEIFGQEGKVERRKDIALRMQWGVTETSLYEALRGKKAGDVAVVERRLALEGGAALPQRYVYRIKSVLEEKLPELDECFLKKIGFDSVENLEESIRKKLEEERHEEAENEFERVLINEIYERVKFEVPESLIELEMERLRKALDPEVLSRMGPNEEILRRIAEDIVKRDIVLVRASDELGIEASPEEVKEEATKRAKGYKVDPESYLRRLEESGNIESIRDIVRRRKALQYLKNQVQMEVIFE